MIINALIKVRSILLLEDYFLHFPFINISLILLYIQLIWQYIYPIIIQSKSNEPNMRTDLPQIHLQLLTSTFQPPPFSWSDRPKGENEKDSVFANWS